MIAIVGALAPIFLLILLGYGLRQRGFVPDAFWRPAETLTYYLFFPALLIDEMARAKLDKLPVLPVAGALAGGVLVVAMALFVLRPWLKLDGPAFTSVVQGAIRPNTYVGLAAAGALYGSPGLTLTALAIGTVVPLVNVLAVAVLARYGTGNVQGQGARAMLSGIARNPIILAVAAGAALAATGIGTPPLVGPLLQILAKAALPVGLLAVGAGLDVAAARAAGRAVLQSALAKLLVVPGMTALAGHLLGLDGLALTVAVLFNALPCSASSYVLARQMGGDHRLIAGIITAQTALAPVTMPFVLVLFSRGTLG